ncbi:MAG: hypothetical protein RCG16_02430 [Rickettsia hoogstraalii]
MNSITCIKILKNFPIFTLKISTAALPFVFNVLFKGKYAISLVKSNNTYFIPLIKAFCTPAKNNIIASGVIVIQQIALFFNTGSNKINMKNTVPKISVITGVNKAPFSQLIFLNI